MALTAKSFSEMFTFSRASTGTHVNYDGWIRSAAVDEPRFEYNPITLENRGVLKEYGVTNSWPNNNPMSAAYFQLVATAASGVSDPMSGVNAMKFAATSDNADHGMEQFVGFPANGRVTFSVFAKAAEMDNFVLDTYTAGATASFTAFDLTNILASPQDGNVTATITPYRDGWYRCSINYTGNAGGSGAVRIKLGNGGSFIGDDVSGLYLWGAQHEDSRSLTSVIPTAGTALVREPDIMNTKALASFSAAKGSFYVDVVVGNTSSSFGRVLECIAANGDINGPSLQTFNSALIHYYYGNDFNAGGVASLGAIADHTPVKLVLSYDQNSATGRANIKSKFNAEPITSTETGGEATISTIRFTGIPCIIADLKYWPRVLTDGEMTTLTESV